MRPIWKLCLALAIVLINTSSSFATQTVVASTEGSAVDERQPIKVLFLGDQGHHQPRLRYDILAPVFAKCGIELTYSESLNDLRLESLQQYDCLVVYANIDLIDADAERGLLTYVRGGGGFVALHCASYCFRNSREVVAMTGAQFQSHGTGVFRVEAAGSHPILAGFGGFESWDETYVHHLHNEDQRTVLEYRVDERGREPWTWIRTEGKGRVFYTAWGHDDRTWTNPGFANLVERGIRWVAQRDISLVASYQGNRGFVMPEIKPLPADLPEFQYEDVGKQIPNYAPSRQWGAQGESFHMMQRPLSAEESLQHFSTPKDFHVELFAAEPDIQGKPIFMTWDERGRLWLCETVDYPNELQPAGTGRDRIRICEDTNGDGRADRFQVFAEGLSIPAALAFYAGGVIVQNGTETIYLKDTNGDDRADQKDIWFRGWNQSDTHGGVSNFQYGLDNWVWAMQGYNHSEPTSNNGSYPGGFHQGFFRFHPQSKEIEYLRATSNNTWGLGLTEEGLVFGSTANGCPSVFLPIPNRYYENVAGWRTSLTLPSIADSNKFAPITDRVRQVDFHGGYTAAAGHSIYAARNYPSEYWNQTAFVCEPTGHLVGTFVLKPNGSGFRSTNLFNLAASNDEWSAPIMAEVGPDGNVWILDWYNFIVQHNPTPQGFQTGKGAAYESKLRDKNHGRIYRVVYDKAPKFASKSLSGADSNQLVQSLKDPTIVWRRHAQRLLVERQDLSVVPQLLALVEDQSVDEIGLNVGAIHALWVLHGLGVVQPTNRDVLSVVQDALRHASAGVRRNALQVLPRHQSTTDQILKQNLIFDLDPQVRLQVFLALADAPESQGAADIILRGIRSPINFTDPNILDAATCAAARHARNWLPAFAKSTQPSDSLRNMATIVAEHAARNISKLPLDVEQLLENLVTGDKDTNGAILRGLVAGWPNDSKPVLNERIESRLESLAKSSPPEDLSNLLQLADRWDSRRLNNYAEQVSNGLLQMIDDSTKANTERINSARKLIAFRPTAEKTVECLLARITPQTEPALAIGWLQAMEAMQLDTIGTMVAEKLDNWSPLVRRQGLELLLSRRVWTTAVIELLENGRLQLVDLSLEQRNTLQGHSDRDIRERTIAILKLGGALPDPNRQAVLDQYSVAATNKGNAGEGKKVFVAACAKCHKHSGEGQNIGPDLTGMAVHPKAELLVHVLDPSRSVESNFRLYQVQTVDGLTFSGMLGGESRTSVDLIDAKGERRTLLREEIEELKGSKLSVMPEGIEKEITLQQMTDLLEFLTQHGTWLPLDLAKVATVASDRGMFYSRSADAERLIFPDWTEQSFKGVPFRLVDPQNGERANVVLLRGPENTLTARLPKEVELPVNAAARAIHFLSGVSGWGYPYNPDKTVTLIVCIHYEDGEVEEHPLRNAEHFADYIRKVDVPKSELAFELRTQQIRYFSLTPGKDKSISKIVLVKGPDQSAPVVMAITVEAN